MVGDAASKVDVEARWPLLVFYGRTGQTKKFVNRVSDLINVDTLEITAQNAVTLSPGRPYVLVTPSYGAGKRDRAVPVPVYKFLANKENRDLCVGTVGGGNTNYGIAYGYAADILAAKLTRDQQRRDPNRETRTLFKFEDSVCLANLKHAPKYYKNFGMKDSQQRQYKYGNSHR